jgi:hypothetical protein
MATAKPTLQFAISGGSFSAAEAAKLSNQQQGSITFGPLKVSWDIDISIPQIIVDASIGGISIGHAVINAANPTVTLGGTIGVATAEIILTANFLTKEIDYDVEVKFLGTILVSKKGKLVGW